MANINMKYGIKNAPVYKKVIVEHFLHHLNIKLTAISIINVTFR